MSRRASSWRRSWRPILLGVFLPSSLLILLFQNCGSAFQAASLPSAQVLSDSPPTGAGGSTGGTGGGTPGGGTTPSLPVDPASQAVSFEFPTSGATTDSKITVRGRSASAWDQILVGATVAQSTDGFLTWKADVPLSMGVNALSVSGLKNGQMTTGLASVAIERFTSEGVLKRGKGGWVGRYFAMTYDPFEQRVIIPDDYDDGAYEMRLSSGDRKELSKSEGVLIGTGFEIVQPKAAIVVGGKRAVTVDGNNLIEIDLVNGNRKIFSQPGGISSFLLSPDQKKSIALFTDTEQIVQIDPVTAAQKVLANRAIAGSTVELRYPKVMAVSWARQIAYVNLFYQDAILAVDLTNGARQVFSVAQGAEPKFADPSFLEVDDKTNQLFVWDSDRLVSIDLATGRRRLFPASGTYTAAKDIGAMTMTPWGLLLLDYIPFYEANPREPTMILIDPVTGTRLVLAR